MKKFVFVVALVALAAGFLGSPVNANEEVYFELLKSDLKTLRIQIVDELMELSDEQADAFWPIYKEYQAELDKLADKRLALIKDYADNYLDMTDEKAGELVMKSLDIQAKRTSLRKSYFKKIDKVLPTTMAAKFMQIDHQIALLVDLQIASELPLVEKWEN